MIDSCVENNNIIYGIDLIPNFNSNNPNYNYLREDSVNVGQHWNNGEVNLVFFDSVHAKEQVLCELYYWWDLLTIGGFAVFHDTSWDGYIHKKGHPCEGKYTGNSGLGYDTYGGINWETPDKAVNDFFQVELNGDMRDINSEKIHKIYEDDNILVETIYCDLGMTFITKKNHTDFKSNISNWEQIFKKRQILLSYFK